MFMSSEREVSAQPPEDRGNPRVAEPKKSASGMPSVLKTLDFGLREMGPVRATQVLLAANQMTGFDCPSCAWPDPEGHRHAIEFCENGAKAIASDVTTMRLPP